MRRLVEAAVSFVALVALAPVFAVVAALIKLDSAGPVLFKQRRIGRNFKPFDICKFRSMVVNAPCEGGPITAGSDPRITRSGRLLRATKIDELPQLINVMKGDMSLVGPRPEVPKYVDLFRSDYQDILAVRPGITDLACLKYPDEAAILGHAAHPEEYYVSVMMPDKIRLAKEYLKRRSILFDLLLILRTFSRIVAVSTGVGRRARVIT
jgi:lipopolysaccharide/colanic/teichoic acid biosynthesis glycosyltransferase